MASQNQNKRNDRRYASYMDEVQRYNTKVDRGRSTRSVDPAQPALSESAELLRQNKAIDGANAYERLMRTR